mmetsp:Transcript_31952/g.105987  ORF Transcript_31952/g.105987 Transcript_31952/m.105987 type:complete len:205 (+) Transcript_31952:885-1499(+)
MEALFGSDGCCFSHVATVPHGGLSTLTFNHGRGGDVACASPTLMASAGYLRSLFQQRSSQGALVESSATNYVILVLRREGSRAFDDDEAAKSVVSSALPAGWTMHAWHPEEMPNFSDQINLVSKARVLIGAHGAGLLHALFLPQSAHLVELFCGDRGPSNHHYRNIEQMSGAGVGRYHGSQSDRGCHLDPSFVREAISASARET